MPPPGSQAPCCCCPFVTTGHCRQLVGERSQRCGANWRHPAVEVPQSHANHWLWDDWCPIHLLHRAPLDWKVHVSALRHHLGMEHRGSEWPACQRRAGPMLSPWLVLQKAAARGWRSLQHASLCRCLVPVPVCTLRRYWDSVNGLAAIRTCLGAAEEQWYLNATGSGIPAVWIVDCCTTNDGRACQSYLSPQGDFQLPVVRTVRCATVQYIR